jgi:SMI1 / KNR4 family (SUKH-1)
MRLLLENISAQTLLLDEKQFSIQQNITQWLGFEPATDIEIAKAEIRLNVKFPQEYIDFLQISNGFEQTTGVHCSLAAVEKIEYLKVLDNELIEIWKEHMPDLAAVLSISILIGGHSEDQQLLMIPPQNEAETWHYWKFASYIPGEVNYQTLSQMFEENLEFLIEQIKRKTEGGFYDLEAEEALKTYLEKQNWLKVYGATTGAILSNAKHAKEEYLALALLASFKIGNQKHFLSVIEAIPKVVENELFRNENSLKLLSEAAIAKQGFLDKYWFLRDFVLQEAPKGLAEIEEQITKHRKDLHLEKNDIEKKNYQFYFLFEFGNTTEVIRFYEENIDAYLDHTKAGLVYKYVNENEKARTCFEKYIADVLPVRPFEVYLNQTLFQIIDKTPTK